MITAIDALMLGYNAVFPLSLILSKKVITKYQMLFRHLLNCKCLERSLSACWLGRKTKRVFGDGYSHLSASFAALQGKMLHFINQISYYMFFEVIEPQWHIMEESIVKAATVDDLLSFHENFLNSCLKECMLTNSKLIGVSLN